MNNLYEFFLSSLLSTGMYFRLDLTVSNCFFFRDRCRIYPSMQSSGKLQLSATDIYDFTSDDLQDLGEIGRGAFGAVNKMVHRK